MKDNSLLKIISLMGFCLFAAVSCWATSESLQMLLPNLPEALCWVVTIGFFVIASWGTKMIADSLNQNIYMERRSLSLWGGVCIVLVFWLLCSMPTNTHTFFYRNLIEDKVTNDISTTQGYLSQIKNNAKNETQAEKKINELKNQVDLLLGELEAEIKSEANPGFGPKSKEILRKFANLLDVDKVEPLSKKGVSKEERDVLCDAYRTKIYKLTEIRAINIAQHILKPNPDNINEAKRDLQNLDEIKKCISEKKINLNDAKDMNDYVIAKLNTAYNTIKKSEDFVDFSDEADKATYTAPSPQTKVKRLLSVYDVWVDFIKGEFGGLSFAFWILVSVLVDIAAFIFFDIAFKKDEV